jgi:hypothetical protein
MARARRKKRNAGGFLPWATEHWFIAGFFLLPAVIALPVGIIRALNPPPRPPPPSGPKPLDLDLAVLN